MVEQAIRIDELSKASLTDEMRKLTGLANPNSVAQLKKYLTDSGVEFDSLGKKGCKRNDEKRFRRTRRSVGA